MPWLIRERSVPALGHGSEALPDDRERRDARVRPHPPCESYDAPGRGSGAGPDGFLVHGDDDGTVAVGNCVTNGVRQRPHALTIHVRANVLTPIGPS